MGVLRRRTVARLAGVGAALAGVALAALIAMLLAQGGQEQASAHLPPGPGTATLTGTPPATHPDLDFSIGVNTDGNTATGDQRPAGSVGTPAPRGDDCVSFSKLLMTATPVASSTCHMPPSAVFQLRIYLNNLGGIPNYVAFDTVVNYTGVSGPHEDSTNLHADAHSWPGCALEAVNTSTAGRTIAGCSIGISDPPSNYIGRIVTIDFRCDASGTITMLHGTAGTDLLQPPYHSEINGTTEALSIDCTAPTSTPTSTPTPTNTPTSTATSTPTVTNTPQLSPTPTVTNTPQFSPTPTLTLTPTVTQTPFPEMSLLAQGTRVSCDTPTPPSTKPQRCQAPVEATPKNGEFQIVVDANRIPGGYGGFNSEVLFGGLDLNSRSCLEEVVWPDRFLCSQLLGVPTPATPAAPPPSKQHKSRTTIFPPFSPSTYIGPLVRINVHCPREGQFKVVLPAITPSRPQGAAFYDTEETPVPVATVGIEPLDTNGDGVPDTQPQSFPLASSLIINCAVIPTFTPTLTPTVTPTATATAIVTPTPCSGPCPTATPTKTPTAINTAPPTNTAAPTNTPTPTKTLTPTPPCCETVTEDLAVPGKVTTDTEGDGATSHDQVETSVTTTSAGQVSINEKSIVLPHPAGFALFGQQVNISAPAATASRPLVIVFWLDASIIPAGATQDDIRVFKGGVFVPNCTGAPSTASPDPCVMTRSLLIGSQAGDVQITVLSSTASSWTFATATAAFGDVNCDGRVNPVDAALVLQEDAGIIHSLPCPGNGDVNGDGLTDARDALLILQFDAGIISTLRAGSVGGLSPWSGFAGLADWARRQ
jgi:hypothetical protein